MPGLKKRDNERKKRANERDVVEDSDLLRANCIRGEKMISYNVFPQPSTRIRNLSERGSCHCRVTCNRNTLNEYIFFDILDIIEVHANFL